MKSFRVYGFTLFYFVISESVVGIDNTPLDYSIISSNNNTNSNLRAPRTALEVSTRSRRLLSEPFTDARPKMENTLENTLTVAKINSTDDFVNRDDKDLETKAIFGTNLIKEIPRSIEEDLRRESIAKTTPKPCTPPLKWTKRGCRHIVSSWLRSTPSLLGLIREKSEKIFAGEDEVPIRILYNTDAFG